MTGPGLYLLPTKPAAGGPGGFPPAQEGNKSLPVLTRQAEPPYPAGGAPLLGRRSPLTRQAEPLVLPLFLFLARSSSPSRPLSISIYLSLSLSLARSRILLARLGGYCLLGSAACRRILLARLGGYW